MEIIPAIDIINGKCVRLTQGDYSKKTIYSDDPVEMAIKMESMGFNRLHLVDLDGAAAGKIVNLNVLKAISQKTSLIIDFGGGIKSTEDALLALESGASMITAGSIAVNNKPLVKEWIRMFGADKIILGADVQNREIMINGWKKPTGIDLFDFLEEYLKTGIRKVICTDIARDGMMSGTAEKLYTEILKKIPGIELIASGGGSSETEIVKLEKMGLSGAIIGKAFYEGKINFKNNLTKRIIPCLDIKNGRTVKGINFLNLVDAGDPVEMGKLYSREGADELVFLDITATNENRKTLVSLVKRIAENLDIPFTVGGGISSVQDVDMLLCAGADKVSINSAACRDPEIITTLAKKFGSQCVVVAIDTKNSGGKWNVYTHGGTRETELETVRWAKEINSRGGGEILLTSMNNDGTKNGFACDITAKVSESVGIPVIASGGAGKKEHFLEVFRKGKADAALAASVFHFGEISLIDLKRYLAASGLQIRHCEGKTVAL